MTSRLVTKQTVFELFPHRQIKMAALCVKQLCLHYICIEVKMPALCIKVCIISFFPEVNILHNPVGFLELILHHGRHLSDPCGAIRGE